MNTVDVCNNMLKEASIKTTFKQKGILIYVNNKFLCTVFDNAEMIRTTKYLLTNGRSLP